MKSHGKCSLSLIFSFVLLASGMVLAEGSLNEHVTVLSSPDAPGSLSKSRVTSCLRELMRQWDLRENELPDLVIYHVSKKAASTAHVKGDVSARKNSGPADGNAYFEVWLVGEPRLDKYILALENILEIHFGLQASEQKRKDVMARVYRMQDAISEIQGK
jgi:hypothetical protein